MTDDNERPFRVRRPLDRVVALGVCPDCGKVHRFCRAHVTYERDPVTREPILGDDGKPKYARDEAGRPVPCQLNACIGQIVCHKHGGKSPNAMRAAAERIAKAEAEEAIARAQNALGAKKAAPVLDPVGELAQLGGEIRAMQQAAAEIVAGIDDDEVLVPTASGMDVHPLVKLLERFTDRSARVLTDMAKLGIAEHMVAVQAGQVDVLDRALRAVLERQGIDPAKVLPELAAELRSIDALVDPLPEIETGAVEGDGTP